MEGDIEHSNNKNGTNLIFSVQRYLLRNKTRMRRREEGSGEGVSINNQLVPKAVIIKSNDFVIPGPPSLCVHRYVCISLVSPSRALPPHVCREGV